MKHEDATRLRLVELRSETGPVRTVRFASKLTLVTGFGPPEPVADWIANGLAGPRPGGVDGIVEVAGRQVGLHDLPPMLLPPQTSIVVSDRDVLAARRAAIEPRYQRVHARRESVSGQRAREEAARAASAGRFAALESRMAELEPSLVETIERAAFDTRRAETMRELRAACNTHELAEVAARQPHPEALELADEWIGLQAQRRELSSIGPTMPVDAARERVETAQRALDEARRRRATSDDAARLHEAQRAVMEAERTSPAADAAERTDESDWGFATTPIATAREAETAAVAELGQTHVSLLLGLVAPCSHEHDITIAETMLAGARNALAQAERVAALPAAAEIATRELDLRAQAAAALGKFPAEDVAAELRRFRPAEGSFDVARQSLVETANESGISDERLTEATALAAARSWLAEQDEHPPVDHSERVVVLTEARDSVETELRAEAAELVAIAARLRDLDRTLSELAAQESRVAAELREELDSMNAADIEAALRTVLHEYASGQRTPGRMPVILGGIASVFEGDRCDGTLQLLERVCDEVQLVVVADRPAVEAWVRRLGPGASVWSPQVAATVEADEHARREQAERDRREAEQRAVAEAEARSRSQQPAAVADIDLAADAARREAEVREQRDAAELARGGVHVASVEAGVVDLVEAHGEVPSVDVRSATERDGIDLEALEHPGTHGTMGTEVPEMSTDEAVTGEQVPPVKPVEAVSSEREPAATDGATSGTTDDWWVPIVSRPGGSRAARPVDEDLMQRRRRAERIAADGQRRQANGERVPTYCDVHRGIETTLHCTRCELPFCDQCLAMLGEPLALHCVDCALEMSGVPAHRAVRRA
jgi:hypothetical protein